MTVYQYCTPEWLEESAKRYAVDPRFEREFAGISQKPLKLAFRVKAEPAWGIEPDLLFGVVVEHGKLLELCFYDEAEAGKDADFILSATPQEWKKLLRKQTKFIGVVMLKKIIVEHGDFPMLLKLAPHGDAFVDALTLTPLQFPDEMTPEELAAYKSHLKDFRARLGV